VLRLRLDLLFVAYLAMSVSAQDPLTKQALGRIEQIEKDEPAVKVGDRQAATLAINSLDWAGKRLAAVRDRNEATWKDAEGRYQALRGKLLAKANATGAAGAAAGYDAAKLAQLDKEVGAAFHNFKIVPAKLLTDRSRTASIERDLSGLAKRLAEFPAGDEAVKAVAGKYAAFKGEFDAAMGQLGKDGEAKGAIDAKLAALDTKYQREAIPGELQPPYTEEQVNAFAADLRRWRDTELKADLEFLAGAAGNATVDRQHVDRLRHWLEQSWVRRVDELDRGLHDRLAGLVATGQQAAEFILATDKDDRDQVTNRILGKGRFDENMARLREGAHAIAMADAYGKAMGVQPPVDRSAAAAKVKSAVAHLQALAVTTLDAVRMPTSASTDAELLRIAEETLKKPDYGVKGWERLVVNADKVRRESREAYVSPGAVNTTITYYHYVWDEYQVATAEKVGDEVWVYFNLLKYYHSGDSTKPIGRWVLSKRFESTRILPENVGK
jgi:hypothetical protein